MARVRDTRGTPFELVLSKLPQAKPINRAQTQWMSPCPAHADRKPSLAVTLGDDGRALVYCYGGCPTKAVVAALGLTMADLMPAAPRKEPRSEYLTGAARQVPCLAQLPTPPSLPAPKPLAKPDEAPHTPLRAPRFYPTAEAALRELERRHGPADALWWYHDVRGEPVGAVVRWNHADGKDIRPVSRHAEGWVLGGMPEPRPLYRLPELRQRADERVYLTEGEKAAEAGRSLDLLTTTSPHGSGSAAKADWTPLAGRDVVILPDNDEAGRRYAEDVTALLLALQPPARVRLVSLPELPPKGDLHDWLEERDSVEDQTLRARLDTLVEAAEIVTLPEEQPDASGRHRQTRLTVLLPPPAEESTLKASLSVAPGTAPAPLCEPILQCLADIEPAVIRWLWPGRIPLGRITMLVGRPGEGKSFVTTEMAAHVSTGCPWPDGTACPCGSIILIAAEDNSRDTIRPRMDAQHGDARRVHLLSMVRRSRGAETMFTLADLPALRSALAAHPDCRLMIVDPVGSFLSSHTDAHRDNDVRAILAPVARLAEQHEAAVVVVAHHRKSSAASADDLTLGSRAFTGVARAVWHVTHDPHDSDRRLLLAGKNNLGPTSSGLAFVIAGEPPVLSWEKDAVPLTADEALRAEAHQNARQMGRPPEDREEAQEWLCHLLADGPLPSEHIQAQAAAEGFNWRTVHRAKNALGIQIVRAEHGNAWTWRLPDDASPHDKTADLELLSCGLPTDSAQGQE